MEAIWQRMAFGIGLVEQCESAEVVDIRVFALAELDDPLDLLPDGAKSEFSRSDFVWVTGGAVADRAVPEVGRRRPGVCSWMPP